MRSSAWGFDSYDGGPDRGSRRAWPGTRTRRPRISMTGAPFRIDGQQENLGTAVISKSTGISFLRRGCATPLSDPLASRGPTQAASGSLLRLHPAYNRPFLRAASECRKPRVVVAQIPGERLRILRPNQPDLSFAGASPRLHLTISGKLPNIMAREGR
jgi:hypothetical protein